MYSSTAARYAGALAEVASELGLTERAHHELREFAGLISELEELRDFLANPAFPLRVKQGVIREIGRRGDYCSIIVNFLLLLQERSRILRVGAILEAFEQELDVRAGVVRAEVTSAHPLDDPVRGRLEQALAELTARRIRANYQIDPALLGGLKVRMGSVVYDGTLQTQLNQLQRELAQ
jgi:F-type H+-transporting ATPase subunit delta